MPHVELPQAEFKVVMLGDTFTGKTSLALRFVEGYYRDSGRSPTVGAFFMTKRLTVDGVTCKIQIWDTAGQEQFKKLAPMYYKSAAAAILCYDCTSLRSFETLRHWMDELQRNVPKGQLTIAMCATKCDLIEDVDMSAAEELADKTGAILLKTSAKANENVTQLFEQVTARVLQSQQDPDSNAPVSFGVAESSLPNTARRGASPTPGERLDSLGNSNSCSTINNNEGINSGINRSIDNGLGNGRLRENSDADRLSSMHNTSNAHDGSTSFSSRPPAPLPTPRPAVADDPAKDDVDTIAADPKFSELNDSSDYHKTCDTNMLMCGDLLDAHATASEMIGKGSSSSCVIQ